MIMSDILFQALVTTGVVLGLWVIARGRNDRMAIAGIVVAAILFGVAISVRPLGVVLPIFAVLPVFLLPRVSWRGTITIALLGGAIRALVTFGWMARNDRWTGARPRSRRLPLNAQLKRLRVGKSYDFEAMFL